MRSLVTGATGQDGWFLSRLLRQRGHTVFGLVHPGDAVGLPEGVVPVAGDLRDAGSLRAALAQAAPDHVYNLAAQSSVAASWREPLRSAQVNGLGAVALLVAAHEWSSSDEGRPVRFVQATSAEIFGAAAPPQDESTPVAPRNPYGAAKAFAHLSVAVHRAAGLHASSAILFNHESERRPADFVTRKITQGVARIANGSPAPLVLGDIEVRRDWGYAADYVEALVLMAEHDEPADYVVATGQSRSIADFVQAAFAHAGIVRWREHVEFDPALQRSGDAVEQRGNPARAAERLGWRPTTTFTELVARMVDADVALLQSGGELSG